MDRFPEDEVDDRIMEFNDVIADRGFRGRFDFDGNDLCHLILMCHVHLIRG